MRGDALPEIVLDRGGVGAGGGDGVVVGRGVADAVLERACARCGWPMPRPDSPAMASRICGDLDGVARERHAHLHAAVVRGDHGLVARPHDRLEELLHLREDAVAVEGGQGEVVDVEDDAALHLLVGD